MATIKEFIEKSLFGKHYPSFKNYIFSESIRDLNKDNHIFYCYKKEIDDNFNKKIGKRQIPYLDRSLFKRGFIEDVDYDNKHGHSDESMTADEKHISRLAGDLKYDEKKH